jgi:hypothetical protein
MVAETTQAPAEQTAKPKVTLATGARRWVPQAPGELRLTPKMAPLPTEGRALARAFLQGVIDCHPSGEAGGVGEIEEYADVLAANHPLRGNDQADDRTRHLLRLVMTAYADAWVASGIEAYHRGRSDEREGC